MAFDSQSDDSPRATAAIPLRPCPFCGGAVVAVENYMRQYPRMDGRYQEPQLLSVTIYHHCPRLTDAKGNYPVLAHYIEVRGRDHETAAAAWNKRRASE